MARSASPSQLTRVSCVVEAEAVYAPSQPACLHHHHFSSGNKSNEAGFTRVFDLEGGVLAWADALAMTMTAHGMPFVGRSSELAALRRAFAQGCRIVTITGMGGGGKSRLASEYASRDAEASESEARPLIVALEETQTAGEVEEAVAAALSARGLDARGDVTSALRQFGLGLIVLDGVEQVATGVGALLEGWFSEVAELRCLVTSRRALDIPPEHVFRLGPLDDGDAHTLLVTRAQASDLTFDPDQDPASLDGIVKRLEGIPLAIEFAGANLGTLTPAVLLAQLEERIGDLGARRRDANGRYLTMTHVLEHSWQLLDPLERQVLSQLGVFAGPFGLDAGQAVVVIHADDAPNDAPGDFLSALDRLHQHGLVRRVPPDCFVVPDVVRDFINHQTTLALRTAAEARHANWFYEQLVSLTTTDGYLKFLFGERSELVAGLPNFLRLVDHPSLTDLQQRQVGLALPRLLVRGWQMQAHRMADQARARFGPFEGREQAEQLAFRVASRLLLGSPAPVPDVDEGAFADEDPALASLFRLARAAQAWAEHRVADAQAHAEVAIALARKTEAPVVEACAQVLGRLRMPADRPIRERLTAAEAAKAIAIQAELAIAWLYCDYASVWLRFDAGEVAPALEQLQALLIETRSLGQPGFGDFMVLDRFEFWGTLGEEERALESLAEAKRLDRFRVGMGRDVLADAELRWALARDDLARARTLARRFCLPSSPLAGSPVRTMNEAFLALYADEPHRAVERTTALIDHPLKGRRARAPFLGLRAFAHAELGREAEARADLADAQAQVPVDVPRWQAMHRLLEAATNCVLSGPAGVPLAQRRESEAMRREGVFRASTFDVQMAANLLRRAITRTGTSATLVVGPQCRWLRLDDQPKLDLERSPLLRRLMSTLIAEHRRGAGTVVSTAALVQAGWPGDRSLPSALSHRLHVALSTLRRRGLDNVLERSDGGYRIEESVMLVVPDESAEVSSRD